MDKVLVWLKWSTIRKALEAFLMAGDYEHQRARETTGEESKRHRAEAEEFHASKADLWHAMHQLEQPMNHGAMSSGAQSSAANASLHEGNTKLVPWLVLTAMLSGFSLATGIFVMVQFAQMQNNMARMSVHIMSNDALLLREGLMQPGDQWAGPEGNLEYGRKDQPKPRK